MPRIYTTIEVWRSSSLFTTLTQVEECQVTKIITDAIDTAYFTLDNTFGRNKSNVVVGDEVRIYADENASPTTLIFVGLVRKIEFRVNRDVAAYETMVVDCSDYTVRLQDITVNEIYTSTEISAIITDLVSKYLTDVTFSAVTTGVTLARIQFKRQPLFDVIKQLADLINYEFYVSNTKVLVFEPTQASTSGYTFNNTNVLESSVYSDTADMANRVWVYGGQQFTNWFNSFTADGAGSAYILDFKPHDTQVTVSGVGGTLQKLGWIKNASISAPTGTQYLVNFDDKEIIMFSGAIASGYTNNIPLINQVVKVNYTRGIPIIRRSDDRTSQGVYGIKDKVIVNEEIKDPLTARDITKSQITQFSNPLTIVELQVQGIANVNSNQTCVVNLPNNNLNNQTMLIVEARYDLRKPSTLVKSHITLRLVNRIPSTEDILKKIVGDIQKIKAANVDPTDIFTQALFYNEPLTIDDTQITTKTRNINDSFIFGSTTHGVFGGGINDGRLGDRRRTRFGSGTNNALTLNFTTGSRTSIGSIADSSSNANTCNFFSGLEWTRQGVSGFVGGGSYNAAFFTGETGAGLVTHSSSLSFSGPLTVEALVYGMSLASGTGQAADGTDYEAFIARKRKTVSPTTGWQLLVSNTKPQFSVTNNADTTVFITGNILPDNTWQHIAGVYDTGSIYIYQNGSLTGSKMMTGDVSNSVDMNIGVQIPTGPANQYRFWHGFMDSVIVSNVAKSGQQFEDYFRGWLTSQSINNP